MELKVNKQLIEIVSLDRIVSGSVELYTVNLTFSSEWDGYAKTVVFKSGDVEESHILNGNTCSIPKDTIAKKGNLFIGVFGTKGTSMMPTVWSQAITIYQGIDTDASIVPPEQQTIYEELRDMFGDLGELKTESKNSTVAAINEVYDIATADIFWYGILEKPFSTIGNGLQVNSDSELELAPISHNDITDRDAENQHPISAISGLSEEVDLLDDHVNDENIHVTEEDKTLWDWHLIDPNPHASESEKESWNNKQNYIDDLDSIRSGASKGATAIQPIPGKVLSSNDYTDEEKDKLSSVEYGADKTTSSAIIRAGALLGIKINGAKVPLDSSGAADIPVASTTAFGASKVDPDKGSLIIGGAMATNEANDTDIVTRMSHYKPITPANFDYTVKRAMCDGRGLAWTESEKIGARERIGAQKGDFTLLTTLNIEEDGVSVIQGNIPASADEIILIINKLYSEDAADNNDSLSICAWQDSVSYDWSKMHQLYGCYPKPLYNTGFIWLKKIGDSVIQLAGASSTDGTNSAQTISSTNAVCKAHGNKLFLFLGNFSRNFSIQDSIDVYYR